ncbi:S-adenosyl-L-methionine-dependent methyltransferase [Thozetella sp. PMI_491]|nr:S-adenosyl-L-methionine-dependent methyltransferase [Thozetella sp. PMI_491]
MVYEQSQSKGLPFPEWFSAMAANYAKQTGDSTRRVFEACLEDIQAIKPITKDDIVHDNAAGPGTAASVLVDKLPKDELPTILVTDNVPPMVQAAKDTFKAWPAIETRVLDSLNLEGIPADHFTHSILNFSVFTFADPLKGLQEIYRTLKPDGLAALLVWKRFGAGEVIHAAQALVRPDLPPMKVPHPEFLQEGVLEKHAVEAGFNPSGIKVLQRSLAVSGPELEEGLKPFMLGDFTKLARAGWTEDEASRWPEVIDQVVKKELDAYGGVKFEAWIVLAKK